jgi:glycerol-3-phosphate O-acyltransferase / dihydroxyacetone phosphate acyltransferase
MQFVDPIILMYTLRMEALRRVAFLIAERSTRRKWVAWSSSKAGAVPIGSALDHVKPATGSIYLPDPTNDRLLIRGIGTKFDGPEIQVGGLLVLPKLDGVAASAEIAEVISAEELRLSKPFKGRAAMIQLTGRDDLDEEGHFTNESLKFSKEGYEGTKYKSAPKVDQKQTFGAIFNRLNSGGAVGIFPEGGSHDRTELLPLKAGVAIMALGSLAEDPDSGLKIVPCGMNYFHAHKFRSRAVIEFGTPFEVPKELVELYKKGERREAIGRLLDLIYQALISVTVTSPDYDTLSFIQAVRRLYNPTGKMLPPSMVVELNRRLVKGYRNYKDDPRIIAVKKSVIDYNQQLRYVNLRDHQVEYAELSILRVLYMLSYRLVKLGLLSLGVIPGLVLFAPVFIASKRISIAKSKEALAASSVKLQGRDVIATWKMLVALAFAPVLYNFYTGILAYWTYLNRVNGYVPDWLPLWGIFLLGWVLFPTMTFAALRFGEIGVDTIKSVRPLLLCLNPSSNNTIQHLRKLRVELSKEVTEIINELGPELFPDFDPDNIFPQSPVDGSSSPTWGGRPSLSRTYTPSSPRRANDDISIASGSHIGGSMPRDESFADIGNARFFATRPPSRSRSRVNSSGAVGLSDSQIKPFSSLDTKANLDEISLKINGAIEERGIMLRKKDTKEAKHENGDATTEKDSSKKAL